MKNLIKPALILLGAMVMAPLTMAQGDADAGQSKAAGCAACHGSDGNSPAAMYPTLAGLGEKYLLKQMHDIKEGVREVPEMAGQLDPMSDEDMQDMAAYFAGNTLALTGAKEIQVKLNSGTDVDGLLIGETIYRFGNQSTGVAACSGCHSPSGGGNAPAGYPRLGGQHADYVAKQLKAFRAGERTNDGDEQIMRAVAQHLSDSEITAVANYIAGLTR